MEIQLLRHATLLVQYAGVRLLVDPMLSPAGAMDPVANSASQQRIPMVPLPIDDVALLQVIGALDGVLVTHLHRDHWDVRAVELLPKGLPILCQPEDIDRIHSAGFSAVQLVQDATDWGGIHITRTGGQHGTGEIGRKMAPVSGFVLSADTKAVLYLAGDTVWCPEVASALATYAPQVVVLNAGAAQFLSGGPITMTAEDVVHVCRARPDARVIAVHMEAVNHCHLTRRELREQMVAAKVSDQVSIPGDGENLACST